ncbi:MAG: recombinase family protein [Proteobacteria bacterium]|nr:recombinase family protein [Pseudomonadota bacterium]
MTRKLRCAIYTRKSTEDGLEQDFNSLDAQREACEAYIKSQQHEGWRLLPDHYDDGGISGGTMERPALQRLLDEVRAGRVDIIVVYKVDRLTRALSDFAKMVDLFDAHDVSFVSVTQQFNTTTSMGRLTLNVLLSFAQFEREVTAERIRDKIAASKKRGMWMGGPVPLGYDSVDKKLVINEAEAETVRALFRLYLEKGNVRLMKRQANRRGLRSKQRNYKSGKQTGGGRFTRGHLYRLLSNPVYIGEVIHKGECYEGVHKAIIDRENWDAVQAQLKRNAANRRAATNARSPSLLSGLLRDEDGGRLVPSHACKMGKRYRYYVSAPDNDGFAQAGWRLPAKEVEATVINGVVDLLQDRLRLMKELELTGPAPDQIEGLIRAAENLGTGLLEAGRVERREILLKIVGKIEVRPDRIRIQVNTDGLSQLLGQRKQDETFADRMEIDIPVRLKKRGVEKKIIITDRNRRPARPDTNLIRAVAQGRVWFEQLKSGEFETIREIARRNKTDGENVTRSIRLAFLAPDIVKAILEGRQPPELTAFHLKRVRTLPLSWDEQRKVLGFCG